VRLRELAWDLERTDTDMYVAPALMDVAGPRTTIRPVAGLPLLHVDHPELAGGRQTVKSVFDKLVAITALIMLSPLFVAIPVAIKLSDRGPVFFRQTRVGKNGHTFRVWKFRTMVVDAEQRKAELTELNRVHMGVDGPTDVLSFPLLPPEAFPPHAGDPDRGPALRADDVAAFAGPPGRRPNLGDVVVSDRRLEMLAERLGLPELASQPAQQAYPCSPPDRLETHASDSRRFARPEGGEALRYFAPQSNWKEQR